jgi:hypothetical protein
MSPSSHRHLSHDAAARERRQLVNVALATVLAFVVAGMVVVLARHNDQPLAAGEVALAPLSTGSVAVSAVAGSATGSITATADGTHRSSAARSSTAGSAARRSIAGSTADSTTTSADASAGIAGIATSRAAGASRPSHPGGHAASSSRAGAGAGAGSTTHRANPPVQTSPTHGATPTRSATTSHPAAPTSTPPTHSTSKPVPPPAPTTHPVTSIVPPPPPPPASSVTISQGDRVPFYKCFALQCYYVAIQLNDFTAGSHTVTCSNSRDGDFATFTTSNTYEAHTCFVWHRDVQVWVTIDGIRSNTLTWNPGHHH